MTPSWTCAATGREHHLRRFQTFYILTILNIFTFCIISYTITVGSLRTGTIKCTTLKKLWLKNENHSSWLSSHQSAFKNCVWPSQVCPMPTDAIQENNLLFNITPYVHLITLISALVSPPCDIHTFPSRKEGSVLSYPFKSQKNTDSGDNEQKLHGSPTFYTVSSETGPHYIFKRLQQKWPVVNR